MRAIQLAVACVAMLVATAGQVQAGFIGPDAFGYQATDDVPFAFQNISGTGTRVLAGLDDAPTSASIGFTFSFYGSDYTTAFFNPNGLITFGSGTDAFSNSDLSTFAPPSNLPSIAVLWDDWQFAFSSGSDAAYYQTLGVSGSQQFIVQWNDAFGFFDSPSSVTFQAILFEGTNDILFQYLDVDSGDFRSSGGSATVGIANTNGHLTGENLQWSFNSSVISNGDAILFSTSSVSPVPEPSSLVLFGFGACVTGVVAACRRRREKKQEATA